MIARVTRWFLIAAPVAAGILVLILGTAGSISTTFGVVLIGIGPIVWMWNWLVRMSFSEDDRGGKRGPGERPRREAQLGPQAERGRQAEVGGQAEEGGQPQPGDGSRNPRQVHRGPDPHPRRQPTRPPRRRP